ncbi:YgaP family membrane protein [Paracoccus marinaquae]|uniref:DUF2892 domain-containing protein n=1 Tax=Paracoccus marinaquae TaxID=2841926 RepID=A0ABS6AIM6_9RHOB|nr:DUF2892 domain-containing protein [Paracoccus marinaquae]MBU3030451.1 DUF2892 domain-containing protein [Paracoccus marinaquae]
MPRNVGRIDRALRIVIGLALIAGYLLFPEISYRWLLLIGFVPLLTGLLGTCPLYRILGINSCPLNR